MGHEPELRLDEERVADLAGSRLRRTNDEREYVLPSAIPGDRHESLRVLRSPELTHVCLAHLRDNPSEVALGHTI